MRAGISGNRPVMVLGVEEDGLVTAGLICVSADAT